MSGDGLCRGLSRRGQDSSDTELGMPPGSCLWRVWEPPEGSGYGSRPTLENGIVAGRSVVEPLQPGRLRQVVDEERGGESVSRYRLLRSL